ncbi:MAG: bL21 family ribosomal protein [Pseudomonadota bacterium]
MFLIIRVVNQQYVIDTNKDNILKVDDSTKDLKVIFASDNGKLLTEEDINKIKLNVEVLEKRAADKKVVVFKKRRRKDSYRTKGHRQKYDIIRVSVQR